MLHILTSHYLNPQIIVTLSVYFLPVPPPLPIINNAMSVLFVVYILLVCGMARQIG